MAQSSQAAKGPAVDIPYGSTFLAANMKLQPYLSVANAVRALEHDPAWDVNRFWYDAFLDRILVANSPVCAWRDEDDTSVTVYLQEQSPMKRLPETIVARAVRLVASHRQKHIVRDWLATIQWDKTPRLEMAFEDYWGVECTEDQPCEYIRAASKNFLIGLMARIHSPGCQLDTMVVFEGAQGIKKTSALRCLADPWYAVSNADVHHKDFFEGLRGKLIIEIGELDSFSRAEVTRVKTVISTPVDHYRPSYGRTALDFPRQCVFVGTTNRDDWGSDETGLRRFWPVKCGDIHVSALRDAREQLFAEAIVRFRAGESWWEMPASTPTIQAARQHHDEWTDPVLAWARVHCGPGYIILRELAAGVLKIPIGELDKPSQMRIARILSLGGWIRPPGGKRIGADVVRVWLPPGGYVDTGGNTF